MNIQEEKNIVFQENNTVAGMLFPDYLNWAAKGEQYSDQLYLPSIQRGFVWSPIKIVTLWDSLLRGMPIGSLLLNRLGKGAQVMEVDRSCQRSISELDKPALGLLDGQQRSLAMLLGWPDGKDVDKCIWIDFGEDGKGGAPFELRISTLSQPFGFQRDTHKKFWFYWLSYGFPSLEKRGQGRFCKSQKVPYLFKNSPHILKNFSI